MLWRRGWAGGFRGVRVLGEKGRGALKKRGCTAMGVEEGVVGGRRAGSVGGGGAPMGAGGHPGLLGETGGRGRARGAGGEGEGSTEEAGVQRWGVRMGGEWGTYGC